MPTIGGVNIGYDVNLPADAESAGLGDDRIRSLKTSVQQAIDAEHNFPAGGGANTGYHVLGSARPYYGAQSLVSSTGSDGRVMQTSDSSRLFGVGSGGTVLYGGATVISAGGYPGTVPQRHYWAFEMGNATVSDGSVVVAIPNSGFSGLPWVVATSAGLTGNAARICQVGDKTATTFRVAVFTDAGVSATTLLTFDWMSIGSRVL